MIHHNPKTLIMSSTGNGKRKANEIDVDTSTADTEEVWKPDVSDSPTYEIRDVVGGASLSDIVMNVDSLSRVMEFSKAKERRNLSCVSSVFKETFDSSKMECTKIAMRKLVEERRERYEFPIITSKDQIIMKCLPKNFRKLSLTNFLTYQVRNVFLNKSREGLSFDDFCLDLGRHELKFITKIAAMDFMDDYASHNTILEAFEERTDIWSIDQFHKDMQDGNKYCIPIHMLSIANTDGDYVTEVYIRRFWDRFIGL